MIGTNMASEIDRVVSFSIPPADLEARSQVKKLKDHCDKTGMNFSHLVIKAIKALNVELGL